MATVVATPTRAPRRITVGPPLALVLGTTLVVIAVVWGQQLVARVPAVAVNAPPFVGRWTAVRPQALLPAAVVAGLAITAGPRLASRLPWRILVFSTAVLAAAWAVALAWHGGGWDAVAAPLGTRYDYLHDVGLVGDPSSFWRGFVDNIGSYTTHVRSHPPGFLLTLWGLDRVGLGGASAAAVLVIGAGASAASAVVLTVRAVADEATARRLAPFVAVLPAAVWLATSADSFFLGLSAWSVALLSIAASSPRRRPALAVVGGVVFGVALLNSYGIVLVALIPAAVILRARRADVAIAAAVGSLGVLLVAAAFGFNWVAGLQATRATYWDGVASVRPFGYFTLANLAVLAVAVGPAVVAGLSRVQGRAALLALAALAAVLFADLSGLSKGEVERIWLPFMPWLAVAAVGLTGRSTRRWLAAQCAVGLGLQLCLRSPW